jgi:hypothetical protein
LLLISYFVNKKSKYSEKAIAVGRKRTLLERQKIYLMILPFIYNPNYFLRKEKRKAEGTSYPNPPPSLLDLRSLDRRFPRESIPNGREGVPKNEGNST